MTSGSGTINTINNGSGLQIKQNSQVLGLNWNSFSIGVGNQVIFDQPSSTSVAINRVVGNNRSEIFGSIQANGQVFLLNPNGVLIARTAQIDTGAFVAAAAQDAKRNTNGSWTVSGISNSEVINQGNIRANGQGGFVVLAGAQVSNEGSLQASSGVALAAGESVSLALDNNQLLTVKVDGAKLKALVQNKGIILADGGAVYLTASGRDTLLGTVVNNEGIIQARGVTNKAGRIILSGMGGDVLNSGKLDVSGKTKGSKGGLVALNGNRVAVTGNAVIDASGVAGGGRVIIGGDQLGKATDVINVTLSDHTVIGPNVRIDIGSSEGNGGFVETSGHQLSMQGTVIGTSAGKAGQWLIDPNDVTISTNTTTNMSANPFTPTGTGAGTVNNSSIETALNSGTDVTITTAGSGTATGNINWTSGDINKTSGGNATLTLVANASITLTGINITASTGALNLNLAASQSTNGTLTLTNTTITTNGGNLTGSGNNAGGAGISLSGTNIFSLGTGNGSLTGTSNTSSSLNIVNTTLNVSMATGSSFVMSGTSNSSTGLNLVNAVINLNSNAATAGSLSLIGSSNTWTGLFINGTNTITANAGNISIAGNSNVGAVNFNGTINANIATGYTFNLTGTSTNATNSTSSTGFNFFGATLNLNANSSMEGTMSLLGNSTSWVGMYFGNTNSIIYNRGLLNICGTSSSNSGISSNGMINANIAAGLTLNITGTSNSGNGLYVYGTALNLNSNSSMTGTLTLSGTSTTGVGLFFYNTNTFTQNKGVLSLEGTSTNGTGTYVNGTINANIASGLQFNIKGTSTNWSGVDFIGGG